MKTPEKYEKEAICKYLDSDWGVVLQTDDDGRFGKGGRA